MRYNNIKKIKYNKILLRYISKFVKDSYDSSKGQRCISKIKHETSHNIYETRMRVLSKTKFGQNFIFKSLLKVKWGRILIFNIIFNTDFGEKVLSRSYINSIKNINLKSNYHYRHNDYKISYDEIFSKIPDMCNIFINYNDLNDIFRVLVNSYKEFIHLDQRDLNTIFINYLVYLRTRDGIKNNNIIMKLVSAIIHMTSGKYICVIPICGIQIRKPIYINKYVIIHPFKDRINLLKHTDYSKICSLSVHNKLNYLQISLDSNGIYTAKHQAYIIAKSIVDSWITFYPYNLEERANVHIGNEYSQSIYGNEMLIIYKNKCFLRDQISDYDDEKPVNLNYYLNSHNCVYPYIQYMNGLQSIRLSNERLNDLNVCISNSNKLIAEGRKSTIYSTKVIKFTTAIESLIKDNPHIRRYDIEKRVANLICKPLYNIKRLNLSKDINMDKSKLKSKIRLDVDNLYVFRNKVAHGEYVRIPSDVVNKLSSIARMVLNSTILLVKFHKIYDRKDLIKYVSK